MTEVFSVMYICIRPLVHIQDYTVTTDLDENYENATLGLSVDVANASTSEVSGYRRTRACMMRKEKCS